MEEVRTEANASTLVPSQVTNKQNSRAGRSRKKEQSNNKNAQGSNKNAQGNNNTTEISQNNKKKNHKKKKKKKNGGSTENRGDEKTTDEQKSKSSQQQQREEDNTTTKIKRGTKQTSKKNPPPPPPPQKKDNQKNRRKNNNRGRRKRFPWRRFIPDGTVDPITLDELVSLPHPPFALCADSPYTVVREWPIAEEEEEEKKDDMADRQSKVLQEQWGAVAAAAAAAKTTQPSNITIHLPLSERKLNLYDGRALAYYMVSQLQFIDPLNRRDLTRDELINLDEYLIRHGFKSDLNVVEAYDAKGVTMSSAGAAASTQAGRAEIRQQIAQALAQSLLSSLFVGGPSVTTSSNTNPLQQQYAASRQHQEQQQQQRARRSRGVRNSAFETSDDIGVYSAEGGGLVVIDDDANPGLRGTSSGSRVSSFNLTPDAPTFTPGALWSASHITSQYMHHEASQHISNFPALAPANASAAAAVDNRPDSGTAAATASSRGPSRSLARITKVVTKTDPRQLQKQREARELFVKRAAMSNLSFGSKPLDARFNPSGLLTVPTGESGGLVSEGQLERNKTLASALGVLPASARQQQNFNEGWARPVETKLQLDDFGNELNAGNYPDSLIKDAREHMEVVLKVEKKWKVFLTDDTSASLPLNKMERPCRKMIHEYSDFWKLHTESFDPEPNRYIHCVKLRDTSAPTPLLSVAARNWRGPRPVIVDLSDCVSKQTAGQCPREFPPPPDREPLQLKPPTPGLSSSSAMKTTDIESKEHIINSRSGELFTGRERPKLELAPRTLPTELPPMEKTCYSLSEERERQQRKRQEQLQETKKKETLKRQMLESAFASDDDESIKSHDSADWEGFESQEPVFVESDEEEEGY